MIGVIQAVVEQTELPVSIDTHKAKVAAEEGGLFELYASNFYHFNCISSGWPPT